MSVPRAWLRGGVRAARVIVCVLAILMAGCGMAERARDVVGAKPERHLVIVSIDGLRPEFYRDESLPAPTLRALARRGSHALGAEPVFPSVTYPNHASIVTGVRPIRHGIGFNVMLTETGERGRWYEQASDLRAPTLWDWARAAGLRTASVSWPATVGAAIDLLVPESDYYARPDALTLLRAGSTPGLFGRLGIEPSAEIFRDIVAWDRFLTATAAAILRDARPHVLLLHLVQLDYYQHQGGREGPEVRPALARIDAHVAELLRALDAAGISERTTLIVTGDHGFQDVERLVAPNALLARAGLRGCPRPGAGWEATVHVAGGAAGVFVRPPGDAALAAAVEAALRAEAEDRYTVLTRSELDALGAMPGAALGLEAAPGFAISGACERLVSGSARAGQHGFLPSRATMQTGFIAVGAGVRGGRVLERIRLIDIAPTAARLLRISAPVVEGRVLDEILE